MNSLISKTVYFIMKNFIITVLVFLFTAVCAIPQESGALKNLQDEFRNVEDISADFKQFNNGKLSLSGKLLYKKSNKLRLELKNAVIISNGKDNWNYSKKDKKVVVSDHDESSPGVFSLEKFIYDYPSRCNITESNENGSIIVNLKPKGSDLNFSNAKLYPNSENFIKKLIISDMDNNQYLIEFSNLKVNSGIADGKFNFVPPEGTKVIDLR